MARLRSFFAFFLSLFAFAVSVPAAGIPWSKANEVHIARGEGLKTLLRNFASGQGITAVIDNSIEGTVSGRFDETDPDVFFKQMVQVYNLVWFYDGNVLYIDPGSAIKTQVIQANYLTADKLIDIVDKLGFASSNSSIHSTGTDEGTIFISGPPRFVSMVVALAGQYETDARNKAMTRDVIRVFPLKYAWAYDLSFNYQGGGIEVPGVASLLQSLVLGKPSTVSGNTNSVIPSQHARKRERVTPTVGDAKRQDGQPQTPTESQSPGDAVSSFNASIESDVRLNAVIIRDTLERMPLYEETINQLDQPVAVIEITAAIVDVDTRFIRELGNRYFSATKGDKGFAISPPESFANSDASGFAAGIANIALKGTVDGYQFLEQVRALEEEDHAEVLSRPSILTLDNIEGIIDQQEQVFIRVRSERDASLFDYSAGTIFKVTPHVIYEEDSRKIKMLVNIQDGKVNNNVTVDTIPTVKQSTITTQAVLNENQSLLIGGLYTRKTEAGSSGIPLLKSLPIIGYLFKSTSRADETVDRMFLITPRIIDVDTVDTSEYDPYFVPPREVPNLNMRARPDGYSKAMTQIDTANEAPSNAAEVKKKEDSKGYFKKHKTGPRRS